MHVVYIASSIVPSQTANSIHVMKMCHALAALGPKVTLIVPDYARSHAGNGSAKCVDPYEYYGVRPIFRIRRLRKGNWPGSGHVFGFRAALLAAKIRADMVYGRHISACFFSALFGLVAAYESHQPIQDAGRYSTFLFRLMLHLKRFRGLVVISDALRRFYLQKFKIKDSRILVAPDAADPVGGRVVHSKLTEQTGRLQVGYIGQLYPGKGVEIIELVATLCPEVDFHVIGGRQQEVTTLKNRTNVLSNVYVHGHKPPSELDSYKMRFDVFVAPYQYKVETGSGGDIAKWMSPLKIFEYMAARRPIVASDLPVIREVLEDGKNAILVKPEDISAWVSAIRRLGNNRRLGTNIAAVAHREFLSKYTWRARAERVLSSMEK